MNWFLLLVIAGIMVACKETRAKEKPEDNKSEKKTSVLKAIDTSRLTNPAGYNLNKPKSINLPKEMDEVSGIVFHAGDNSIYAICDDKGSLYRVSLSNPEKVSKWKFKKQQNYEDLVFRDNTFYILDSNGDILVFEFDPNKIPSENDELDAKTYKFPYKGENEFETLYYDQRHKKLILICKGCEDDKKKTVSVFAFDYQTREYSKNPFEINADSLASIIGKKDIRFKASAGSIHPITGELYIISSINKLIVVADKNGNAKEVHQLDPSLYKKPEGITFNSKGDMYISNESDNKGPANILIFRYNMNTR